MWISSDRRSLWTRLVALVAGSLIGVAVLFMLQHCHPPLFDSHPRRLGSVDTMNLSGATEADFDAAFGCRGRLVSGNRTPGTPYTVEWSDDTGWKQVTFDANGKWMEIKGAPFFGLGPSYIPTPYERLKLKLREMGLNVR
jgi:hypothetical protein